MEGNADMKWDTEYQGEVIPLYVGAVPRLDKDMVALKLLTWTKNTPVRHIIQRYWYVDYFMGDASGNGFRPSLWRENMV